MKTNTKSNTPLFDVLAVNIKTNIVRALFGESKTYGNADAIVSMAVMRRGVDEEFYCIVNTGTHKKGDEYDNQHDGKDPRPPRDPDAHIVIGNVAYPSGPRGL